MDNNTLINYLQDNEAEIAALTTKLVNFLEAEKINAPLAIGCLSETLNRLTTFVIKNLDDPKAAQMLAEQMAGVFVNAIGHSLQAYLKDKHNQTPYLELATPDDVCRVASDLGHA